MSFSVQDEDLETDLNKLCRRPEPDRPRALLKQYERICPELVHEFQVKKKVFLYFYLVFTTWIIVVDSEGIVGLYLYVCEVLTCILFPRTWT